VKLIDNPLNMLKIDWQPFASFAEDTARGAGQILMDHLGRLTHIRGKSGGNDLVTEADLSAEEFITRKIKLHFPEHSILSEENSSLQPDSEYCWVVDPLDGTTNFVHQYPEFAVSIGLQFHDHTVLGVVYNPAQRNCFTACLNQGAFLDGRPIRVSTTSVLAECLLLTGFPYRQDELWEANFELFKSFYRCSQGVRRLGAASLDLCYVASGRFDGFWEFHLKPWDICAGEFILREAGGKTSDWTGGILPFDGNRVLATNDPIHRQMINIINQPRFDLFKY